MLTRRVLPIVVAMVATVWCILAVGSVVLAQGESSVPPGPALTAQPSATPTPASTSASLIPGSPMLEPPVVISNTTPPLDWDIPSGHFFTQADGYPLASSPRGFAITDDGSIPFWTEFKRLGGVDVVGYPISNRFELEGFTLQAMQKGVLQWRPDVKQAWFVNVFDLLHDSGKDDWLTSFRSVPKPLGPSFDKDKSWNQVLSSRLELLDAFPAIKKAYRAVPDPINLYGLPTSRVEDMGTAYVVRLQRAVIQQWKLNTPWARAGDVTVANGGDIAKEAGLFSSDVMEPTFAPAGTWKLTTSYRISGRSTWYGAQFNRRRMADGQIYDLNDPTTVASNMYPFGTRLKITNIKTGKSLVVVVKDMGDFCYPIVTDLSQAAFAKLANPAVGIIDVAVEVQP